MRIRVGKKVLDLGKLLFAAAWVSVIAVFLYINLEKYSRYDSVTALNRELVYLIQVNMQKMFFNANVLFSVFLYRNKKEYLNPMLAVRYGRKLFAQIVCTGFEYALIFTVCTYLMMPCVALILQLQIDLNYMGDMWFFYLIILQMYFVYSLLYVITERLAVSLVSTMVLYVILTGIVITVQYMNNTNSMDAIGIYHWPYFMAVDMVLLILLYRVISKKDLLGKGTV